VRSEAQALLHSPFTKKSPGHYGNTNTDGPFRPLWWWGLLALVGFGLNSIIPGRFALYLQSGVLP
jgi:hypothetical protein